MTNILIVSGDGLIGSALAAYNSSLACRVITTTRKRSGSTTHAFYLDLAAEFSLDFLDYKIDSAFLCAGITNIFACEADSVSARKVNVDGILSLATMLADRGVRLIFLSSNSVFDGRAEVDEFSLTCPTTEYGRQKAEVENALLKMKNVAIVRLSKVMSSSSGMASDFIRRLSVGDEVEAFDDLIMTPVSLEYVVESLTHIAQTIETGIFHLSSDAELSYFEMACGLATRLNVEKSKVRRVSSKDKGIEILFKPAHPALGMGRTTNLLGIVPEPIDHVFDQLIKGLPQCEN